MRDLRCDTRFRLLEVSLILLLGVLILINYEFNSLIFLLVILSFNHSRVFAKFSSSSTIIYSCIIINISLLLKWFRILAKGSINKLLLLFWAKCIPYWFWILIITLDLRLRCLEWLRFKLQIWNWGRYKVRIILCWLLFHYLWLSC